ncbi:MAG: hypothetical protein JRE14_03330 [Deltaproteobacteria bacterium]|nr:hypothetical protein [Deltaproteobacteria bacterium]
MGKLTILSRIAAWLFCVTVLFFGISSFAWSAQSDYDGAYAGTYAGDDNGYWVAVADATGTSAFLAWSTANDRGDAGTITWWEENAGIGNYYTGGTEIQGSWVDAFIDSSDSSVAGEWGNPQSGDSGTLEGDILDASAFSGDYSGSFCGEDSGTWSITINADGSVTGTMASDNYGNSSFIGVCHPAGYVFGFGENNGEAFAFFGQISGTDINGEWIGEDGSSGALSTSACTSGGGSSSGGGGGGGCFILTVNQ